MVIPMVSQVMRGFYGGESQHGIRLNGGFSRPASGLSKPCLGGMMGAWQGEDFMGGFILW